MQYCGMDLGKKSSNLCVVDKERTIIIEGKVRNTAEKLYKTFSKFEPMPIVIEASTKAFWVADILREMGHKPIVVDPGRTKAIGASLIKHDKLDARVLAMLCAAGLLSEVNQPSEEQRLSRMPAVSRGGLIDSRARLVQMVRSMLDSEGIEIRKCATEAFVDVIFKNEWETLPPQMADAIEPVLNAIDSLSIQIEQCDDTIKETVKEDEDAALLMSAPGVGPIVAFCFLSAIRDPNRFSSGRTVGAYLGLVPSLYQSGKTYRRGRITKHGNRQARWALTMAANALLRTKKESALKEWGQGLVERVGRKKATVAIARILASVLWSMWRSGKKFEPRLSKAKSA